MTSDFTVLPSLNFEGDFVVREGALETLRARLSQTPSNIQKALRGLALKVDEFQDRVVVEPARTIRMVAPAGSGKTQTVVNRVVRQVGNGTSPDRVLVLTFDTSAASSLRSGMAELLGATEAPDLRVRISTLNAYGYSLLREEFPQEYKPIVTRREQFQIVRHVLDEVAKKAPDAVKLLPKHVDNRLYLELNGLLKNQLFDPRDFKPQEVVDFLLAARQVGVFFSPGLSEDEVKWVLRVLLWVFKSCEVLQRERGKIDFDDQKLRAFRCLEADASVTRRVQAGLDEVVVDEFQDINKLDFELIRLIAKDARLVVTGDDDQAIYGFRGCSPEYIIHLDRHLGRPIVSHELRTNYRCPPNLVRLADRLIRHNKVRIAKQPIAARTEDASIVVVPAYSAAVEATLVRERIEELHRDGFGYEDVAILYRTNSQSLPLQVELLLAGIPFTVREEDDLRNSEILKNLIGLLRAKAAWDEDRRPSVADSLSVVRSYFKYVSRKEAARLENLLREAPLELIVADGRAAKVMPKIGLSRLADGLDEVKAARSLGGVLNVAAQFRGLRGMIGSFEDVADERVPLGEIFDIASGFRGSIGEFAKLLDDAVQRAIANAEGPDDVGKVALLTFFRAKGRQWHTVFLVGCSQGLIPHWKADVEEERRLMYVGMTRASSNLVVSYLQRVCKNKAEVSQFLREAGVVS